MEISISEEQAKLIEELITSKARTLNIQYQNQVQNDPIGCANWAITIEKLHLAETILKQLQHAKNKKKRFIKHD